MSTKVDDVKYKTDSGGSGGGGLVAVALIGALLLLLVLFALIFSVIAYVRSSGSAGPPGASGASGASGAQGTTETAAQGISTDTYTITSTSKTRFYVFTAQPNSNTSPILVTLPSSALVPGAAYQLANVQAAAGLVVSPNSSVGDSMSPNSPTVLAAGEIGLFYSDGFGHWYVVV